MVVVKVMMMIMEKEESEKFPNKKKNFFFVPFLSFPLRLVKRFVKDFSTSIHPSINRSLNKFPFSFGHNVVKNCFPELAAKKKRGEHQSPNNKQQ